MNLKEARIRIKKLRDEIKRANHAYHTLDEELISDATYDSLARELISIERQFPKFKIPNSPTERVGGIPLEKFQKVYHEKPMISLNDAFSRDDVEKWFLRLKNYFTKLPSGIPDNLFSDFYCELKIDGLAIELIYQNGIFVKGITRGNGLVGEDVTQNLKTISAIPLKILSEERVKKNLRVLERDPSRFETAPRHLVVRGEIFLTKEEFNRINIEQKKKEEKLYANPRNVAAGSIRQLDPKITASRKLDSFQYAIVTDIGQKTHEEEHILLEAYGFKTNKHNKRVNGIDEVFAFRDYWETHREQLEYEIDGTVIIINNNKYFESAGIIGKAPRAAIAYKFIPREKTTILKNITIQVGRTGVLTPVAELVPVNVGGTRVSRATLHNYNEIQRLGIRIGDTVVVTRAGDVIPKITRVITNLRVGKEKEFVMPDYCPIDGSKIKKEGALYKCSSPLCGARHRENIYHFVSRTAFDIRGLGPKIIDAFLDAGLIADAADLFTLQKDDIAVLNRFGEKSAENIVKELASKKEIPLHKFLFGLGILQIGEETSIALAKHFPLRERGNSLEVLAKRYKNLTRDDLEKVSDIGPKVAESIYTWFHMTRNIKFVEKLGRVGIKISNARATQKKNAKIASKTFVLTGTISSLSRDEAKAKIRELGGEISESVSPNTDFVVAGENPGAKYGMAKKLGIKIVNEAEFLELLS